MIKKMFKQYYTENFSELITVPANPQRKKICRIIDTLKDPWHAQFTKNGGFFSMFTTTLSGVVGNDYRCGFDFIPWNRHIISGRDINSISSLAQMKEMYNELQPDTPNYVKA